MVQQYMKDPSSVDGTLAHAGGRGCGASWRRRTLQPVQGADGEGEVAGAVLRYFYALWPKFPKPQLTKQTLASTLTPAVRGQDLYILLPMLDNPASQNATWDFMRNELRRSDEEDRRRTGRRGSLPLRGAELLQHAQKASRSEAVLRAASLPRYRTQSEGSDRVDQRLRRAAQPAAEQSVCMVETAEWNQQRLQRRGGRNHGYHALESSGLRSEGVPCGRPLSVWSRWLAPAGRADGAILFDTMQTDIQLARLFANPVGVGSGFGHST